MSGAGGDGGDGGDSVRDVCRASRMWFGGAGNSRDGRDSNDSCDDSASVGGEDDVGSKCSSSASLSGTRLHEKMPPISPWL